MRTRGTARRRIGVAFAVGVAAMAIPFVAAAPAVPTLDQRISGLLIGTAITCGYLLISTLAVVKPFSVRLDG